MYLGSKSRSLFTQIRGSNVQRFNCDDHRYVKLFTPGSMTSSFPAEIYIQPGRHRGKG
jgi:hypothetical protein